MTSLILALVLGQNLYRVDKYEVHDGDTLVNCTINLGFGVALVDKDIRAFGYDACEVTRTRRTVVITAEELATGIRCREAFKQLLARSGPLYISEGRTDPYGRLSGIFWLDIGQPNLLNIGQWMKDNEFLRR
jgi:hypothetical protein